MRFAYPAFVVNLMLSDVVGDDPDTVASGPFVPDRSTFRTVMEIRHSYSLAGRVSAGVLRRIQEGVETGVQETPREKEPIFTRVRNVIMESNIPSLEAGPGKAVELGYNALVLSSTIEDDPSEAGLFHAAVAAEIRSIGNPVQLPACILSEGETTVVLKGQEKRVGIIISS